MYTLYALRGCITERDIPVLRDLLRDRDRIIRLAVSSVLADLGTEGKTVIQRRLSEVTDAREKLMLQESLDTVGRSGYRQILQYPLTDAEHARIRGCN
jgi:HEAT repeat protein